VSSLNPTVRRPFAALRAALALVLGTALAVSAVPTVASAAPVTLYSETFASAPAGWSYTGVSNWSVSGGKFTADAGGFSGLPALNYATASRALSTTGHQDVAIRFDYSTAGLTGESLFVNHSHSGGGYNTIILESSNVAETSTGWVSLSNVDDIASFVLQISLVGNGASTGATVTIDNLELRGEPIPDSTAPTITGTSPANGTVVPVGSATYSATVSDDETVAASIDVEFEFRSVANPALIDTVAVVPSAGGDVSTSLLGSNLATTLGLVQGDQFEWRITAGDATGNENVLLAATLFYLDDEPVDSSPVISSAAPPDGRVDVVYDFDLEASGYPVPTFTVSSGLLPPGVTLSGGTLAGTPTTPGTYDFTITATNGVAPADDEDYTVVIAPAYAAPTITSPEPPDAILGAPYTFTFTADAEPSTVIWAPIGVYPLGLSFSGSTLSGTPTTLGSYTFDLNASNGRFPDAFVEYTIEVVAGPIAPTITSADPPHGVIGVAYDHPITTSGAPAPSLAVSDGALPPGVTLTAAGLSGTPTTVGSYDFEITASNGTSPDAVEEYTVEITVPQIAPTIVSAAPPAGEVGVAYSFTVDADGSPDPGFSASGLPTGLSIDSATGLISGTPTSAGTSASVEITAANGVGPDAVETYSIDIVDAISTTGWPPSDGVVGDAYSFTVTSTGPGTLAFAAVDLPPGLGIDPATGVISGTPTTAGSFPVTVTVSNGGVSTPVDSSATITIDPAPVAPTFTSAVPADGTVGTAYSHQFVATGDPPIAYSLTAGDLPLGLTLVGDTLSGTPTTADTYTFDITAGNGAGSAVQTATVTIVAAPIAPGISGTPGPATVDVAYAFAPSLTGTGPFTVTLSDGVLPTGLVLDGATGQISGSPLATAGDYPIELTVSGAASPAATLATSIEVLAGAPVSLPEVRSGLQSAGPGGTMSAGEGGGIALTVVGVDSAGNEVDVTADVVFTSDVPTDVVTGNVITFPTASPHAITAVHAPTLLTIAFVVEVRAASTGSGSGGLANTGNDVSGVLTGSLLTMLVGLGAVAAARRLRAPVRGPAGRAG
jgi:hypothetical protein